MDKNIVRYYEFIFENLDHIREIRWWINHGDEINEFIYENFRSKTLNNTPSSITKINDYWKFFNKQKNKNHF